jgi:DNA-binding transcriptional LysR family regulator
MHNLPGRGGTVVSVAAGGEIDWDDLRYFLWAARQKTLAGAARALRVEHTTIGRRLSALERSLGVPLVLRGPEGLTLTALGAQVAPLVEDVERTVEAVREMVASQRARVRLAVPSGVTALFTPHLPALRDEHPGLVLELVSGARPVDLKKGEADLAIRSGPAGDEELVARKLCDSGFALYGSAAYLARRAPPADPGDLSRHDLIGFDPSLSGTPAAQWIETRAKGATIVLRSREMTDMLAAAVSGTGLAILPCMLADAEPALRRLTGVVLTRPLSLVYRREARLAKEVRAVIRFVVDVVRQHADRISGTQAGSPSGPPAAAGTTTAGPGARSRRGRGRGGRRPPRP